MSHPIFTRRPPRSLLAPFVALLALAVLVLGTTCVVLAVLLWQKPTVVEGGAAGAGEARAPAPAKGEPKGSGAGKADERDGWTHKELVEHLNKNGARVRIWTSYSWDGRLQVMLCDADAPDFPPPGSNERIEKILVALCKDKADAREWSGAQGADAIICGRFVLVLDDNTLGNRIRAALK